MRRSIYFFAASCCFLLLSFLFSACRYGPSATSMVPTPTATPTPGALTNYTNEDYGFFIAYPAGWQIIEDGGVFFQYTGSSPNGSQIRIQNGSMVTDLQAYAESFTDRVPIISTVAYGGATWQQAEIEGRGESGETTSMRILLGSNPAEDAPVPTLLITCLAPAELFTEHNITYFEPALHTFQFI